MATFVLPLADPHAMLELLGGMGRSLAMEAQAGLPEPNGLHITTETCRQFITAYSFKLKIPMALQGAEVSNLQTARAGFRCHWGLWHGQEIEGRGDGIRLLDEWGYFDCPEPRLASICWMRPFETLLGTLRIYHFKLGEPAE